MAFVDLASNEMVTFTNAATGGFTLNAGQSNVTSNECMTKTQALTKYNLSASAMSAYASNQLVPKSTWVNGITYYAFCTNWISSTSAVGACSSTLVTDTLYTTNSSGIINTGDVAYYLFSGVYYPYDFNETPFASYNEGSTRKVLEINATNGTVISKNNCSSGPTYDLYNADIYDCTSYTAVGTEVVAFPTGTSVSYSLYYVNSVTAGVLAYKVTSTSTTGPGTVLETTGYTTLVIACDFINL
jgi:hypothetical protein